MKNFLLKLSTTTLFIILYLISNQVLAQDPETETLSRDELKLIRLETKVKRFEAKIEATEAKIAVADSIIQAGIEIGNMASIELRVIAKEDKLFVKENNGQRKVLAKKLRKADDEDVKSIESEIKAIDAVYKTAIRAFDKRYRVEEKILVKAKSNDDKGKVKLKQYKPKLKEYLKALELAKENLAAFKTEKNL
ncbi:MAG: hypothetical protein PF485_15365 [Bacteroidales bacterium]|jgi:hypothetical protein|nr:hypothetical protein [Bacteroidales bacterium]